MNNTFSFGKTMKRTCIDIGKRFYKGRGMIMKKNESQLWQKIKDNAFYVAFGVGLVALFGVVAVYTVEENNKNLANADVKDTQNYTSVVEQVSDYVEDTEETKSVEAPVSKKETLPIVDEASADKSEDGEASKDPLEDRDYALPVYAAAGELTFNGEETISWPVNGEVILPYSMDTTVYFKTLDQYKCNPGMLITAGSGTTVKSAYLGKVTKVTSDNEYGNMVTVYLGNDYSAVYGQLDTIYVKEGDYVKTGDSIGTVSSPTDSFSEEGSHLFFQMLQGEVPVDPTLFME